MAKLSLEIDLGPYQDSLDGSVFMQDVQADIDAALLDIWIRPGAVASTVLVKHHNHKVGTLTVNMEG